jgi:hypothetical protein
MLRAMWLKYVFTGRRLANELFLERSRRMLN